MVCRSSVAIKNAKTDLTDMDASDTIPDAVAFDGTVEERDAALARLERFANLMDSAIDVPGTDFRLGLEPIVGLVPGVGDFASAIVSCYVPLEAIRLGASPELVFKMLFVILIDAALGSIPVFGDAFDALFKANKINVEMLEEYLGVD
jgi:hypothetical protein